jgi:fatty acid-binding protein DegV
MARSRGEINESLAAIAGKGFWKGDLTEFTPAMGVHTGPGAIGLAFCTQERREATWESERLC